MLKFLIQDTARLDSAILKEIEALKELNIPFSTFGIIPFTTTVTGIDDLDSTDPQDTYIIRAGTKMLKLLEAGTIDGCSPEMLARLRSGVSYSVEAFDQAYYGSKNLPVLNDDSEILDLRFDVDLHASFSVPKFIKPSSDLKAFTAGVMEAGEVLKYFIERHYYVPEYRTEKAIVSSVKEISSEYRFVCLKGKVLQGSRYHLNGYLSTSTEIPEEVLRAASEYAGLYEPSDIYTMDLCTTPDGIKIVEYNAWNCSGLYDIDAALLFKEIYQYYLSK